MASIIGLDVGGANIKAAHSGGQAISHPFQLWKNPNELGGALKCLLDGFPPAGHLAVTMTGELCDCFASKRDGVVFILDCIDQVSGGMPVRVWRNDGAWTSIAEAVSDPLPVASANWLASATFLGRFVPKGPGLVMDIGSTTTDLTGLVDGFPVPVGRTDVERLMAHELIYTGVKRTPVCALLGEGGAAEFFATAQDVYTLLGFLPENPDDVQTADGRPATLTHSYQRLIRMKCADSETMSFAEARELAQTVSETQITRILNGISHVVDKLPQSPGRVLVAGSGEFLGELAVSQHPIIRTWEIIRVSQIMDPSRSECLCAWAVANLALDDSAKTH